MKVGPPAVTKNPMRGLSARVIVKRIEVRSCDRAACKGAEIADLPFGDGHDPRTIPHRAKAKALPPCPEKQDPRRNCKPAQPHENTETDHDRPQAKHNDRPANQYVSPLEKRRDRVLPDHDWLQSPSLACQSVIAATAAVSARRMRGPKLTAWVNGKSRRRLRSRSEKPPSGPIRMPQGCPLDLSGSGPLSPASPSSQNMSCRSSGHSVSKVSRRASGATSGTYVPPHCSAASIAWA